MIAPRGRQVHKYVRVADATTPWPDRGSDPSHRRTDYEACDAYPGRMSKQSQSPRRPAQPATSRHELGPGTGEVTVRARDLARLLLEFRSLQLTSGKDWSHMHDYDISFERLADVLDADGQPDPRLRCGHQPTVDWPKDEPDAAWYNISTASDAAPPRHRHLATARGAGLHDAYCGFLFADEDIVRSPSAAFPDCPVCVREQRLRREHQDQSSSCPRVVTTAGCESRGLGAAVAVRRQAYQPELLVSRVLGAPIAAGAPLPLGARIGR